MRAALLVLTLTAGCAGRLPGQPIATPETSPAADEAAGYVDVTAAIRNCVDGKKAKADDDAAIEAARKKYTEATAEAAKLKTKPEREAAQQKAQQDALAVQQQAQNAISQATEQLGERIARILPKLAAAHRLDAVVPGPWMAPRAGYNMTPITTNPGFIAQPATTLTALGAKIPDGVTPANYAQVDLVALFGFTAVPTTVQDARLLAYLHRKWGP